jgi:rRNA small subunit pseudouridine methyltransferase Nep1
LGNSLVTFLWRRCDNRFDLYMVLTLVLVESALQLVPQQIQSHPQIRRYAERRAKGACEVLLDRAFHNTAMRKLAKLRYATPVEKMGRPDIVHNTLLQVLETPLNWEGHLRVLVHTQDDHVITINPKVRLPKNYLRFVGLIEQLFAQKKVPMDGELLLRLDKGNLLGLVRKVAPTKVFGFSTLGKPTLMKAVADRASKLQSPLVLIGAFPRGHFTEETKRSIDEIFSVDRESLDAWVVAGRFVYDFEWALGLSQDRVSPRKTR